MPFEIHDRDRFLFARLFGTLSREDLIALAIEVERLEEESPLPKNRVTDATSLQDIDVGYEAIYEIATLRGRRPLAAPVKSALIARHPLHFGFARMFQTLNDNPRIDVRIVGSMEEALQWFEGTSDAR